MPVISVLFKITLLLPLKLSCPPLHTNRRIWRVLQLDLELKQIYIRLQDSEEEEEGEDDEEDSDDDEEEEDEDEMNGELTGGNGEVRKFSVKTFLFLPSRENFNSVGFETIGV